MSKFVALILLLAFALDAHAKGSTNHQINASTEIEVRPANYVEFYGDTKIMANNELRFLELSGADYISLKSPSSLASVLDFILPSSYGTSGQCLKGNGSGTFSFGDCLTVSPILAADTQVVFGIGNGSGSGKSSLTFVYGSDELNLNGILNLQAQTQARFQDASGGEYVALRSPSVLAGNLTFTLPGLDGALNECLKTNGSGVLSFGACGSNFAPNVADQQVVFGVGPGSGSGNANLIFDYPNNELELKGSLFLSGNTSGSGTGTFGQIVSQNDVYGSGSGNFENVIARGFFFGSGSGEFTGKVVIKNQNPIELQDSAGGDYVRIRANATTTNYTLTMPATQGSANQVLVNDGSGNFSWGTSGGTQLAPVVKYRIGSGNTISNNTLTFLDFSTKVYDDNDDVLGEGGGPVTTQGTGWRYPCPNSGYYFVFAGVSFNGAAWTDAEQIRPKIYVNGVETGESQSEVSGVAAGDEDTQRGIPDLVYCAASQLIEIAVLQTSGGNLSTRTGTNSYVTIMQIPTNVAAVSENRYDIYSTAVDYTVLDSDGYSIINVTDSDPAKTITLPTAADNTDRCITIVNNSTEQAAAARVIVDGEGAETISGLTTVSLRWRGRETTVCSTGTAWIERSTNRTEPVSVTIEQTGTHSVISCSTSPCWVSSTVTDLGVGRSQVDIFGGFSVVPHCRCENAAVSGAVCTRGTSNTTNFSVFAYNTSFSQTDSDDVVITCNEAY
jgi:hypothetical protein